MKPAPGLLRQILCRIIYHPDERLERVAIDQPITDGEILPIAGGIDVVHLPGHCAGQVAVLWRPGRMLFAADVFMNVTGLGDPLGLGTCKAATHCRNDSRLLLRTGNLLSLARLVSRPFPCVHAAVALPFELFQLAEQGVPFGLMCPHLALAHDPQGLVQPAKQIPLLLGNNILDVTAWHGITPSRAEATHPGAPYRLASSVRAIGQSGRRT